MSETVKVLSVDQLDHFNARLTQFREHANEVINRADAHTIRALEWIEQREHFWRQEVSRRKQIMFQAIQAYHACTARVYTDPETGIIYRPNCSAEQHAVERIKQAVKQAEDEHYKVGKMRDRMREAIQAYRHESGKLRQTLNYDIPKSNAYLKRKSEALRRYLNTHPQITPEGMALLGLGVIMGATAVGVAAIASSVLNDSENPNTDEIKSPPQWIESGIQNVPLAKIDLSDSYIESADDYKKVPYETMRVGVQRLIDVIRPAVQNGANADYFREMDSIQGLNYEHGYLRVYEAFYGNEPVRLEKLGDTYKVVNGYHRLKIAQEMGLTDIPALVNEKL